jgi:hypothetical protein
MTPETQAEECKPAVGQINQNGRETIYFDQGKKEKNYYQQPLSEGSVFSKEPACGHWIMVYAKTIFWQFMNAFRHLNLL